MYALSQEFTVSVIMQRVGDLRHPEVHGNEYYWQVPAEPAVHTRKDLLVPRSLLIEVLGEEVDGHCQHAYSA